MNNNKIILQLQEVGWNVKEEYVENLSHETLSFQSAVKLLLNADLKESGVPYLPSDLGKGKSSQIKTPIILQVTNVRNVSAPKANEESATAPRMLRLTLTDGINYVHGLEISFIKSLSLKTAPGTKIKLFSKIPIVESYLLLNPSNTELVGGVVEELFQKWKLSESVSKYSRSAVLACDGSGPPLWVPFGKKILAEKERNFKAMGDTAAKKKENDEFEVQRQQVVQELTKEGSQKVFGGGKQMLDSNVQKIINSGGFTIEEAEWALKRNKNDLKKALQDLKRAQNGEDEISERASYPSYEERGKMRGKRGRGKGRGKDNKGPDGSDDEAPHTVMARPSGPASLLDYLESRITEKGGEVDTPRMRVDERQEHRYPPRGRDQRGRRGRGRGREREDFRHSSATNVQKNEPSFSIESWPSLGEEPRNNSVAAQPHVDRNTSQSSTSSPQSTVTPQQNYSHSQSERKSYPQTERNDHYTYKDNQHYRGGYSNYKSSNPSNNYREQSSYQQNTYKDNNQQQYYRSEPQNFDEAHRRRVEQPYYRRGIGREMHRGDNSSFRGQQSRNQPYANNTVQSFHQDDYYRAEGSSDYGGGGVGGCGGGGGGSVRVHTPKEKELIAQFEKSMVIAGCYEDPSYGLQNRNYSQGYRQGYYDSSYSSQGFSGSFEFHRGGAEGYSRRSRGRRARY